MADSRKFHAQQGGRAANGLSASCFLVIAELLAGEPVAIAQQNVDRKDPTSTR